jgi:hypothetical protein
MPGRDNVTERLLAHLENNGDDERVRELASDVLHGRSTLTESLAASFYAEALLPKLDGFAGWYEQLSDADRAAEADLIQVEIEKLDEQNR